MIDAPTRAVSDVIAEFLACKPSDEEVLAYFIPPDLQARVEFLLVQNRESELSVDDKLELHEFLQADQFMGLLKVKTRLGLRKQQQ
ncbi:MAG: hypothetical protein OXE52_02055 [Chloroflexi bacterium]|nr:hypothetical protein [Chloroflexota bacterium]